MARHAGLSDLARNPYTVVRDSKLKVNGAELDRHIDIPRV
jgi:hypothetical protein